MVERNERGTSNQLGGGRKGELDEEPRKEKGEGIGGGGQREVMDV